VQLSASHLRSSRVARPSKTGRGSALDAFFRPTKSKQSQSDEEAWGTAVVVVVVELVASFQGQQLIPGAIILAHSSDFMEPSCPIEEGLASIGVRTLGMDSCSNVLYEHRVHFRESMLFASRSTSQ
jgi:hypothetical protein